ncbi:MAG: hydrogenase formation protein HypD [Dehalococcoidales bacterium]
MEKNKSYSKPEMAAGLIQSINQHAVKEARYMEFCGSHTVSVMRNGLRQLLPQALTLTSGPGCPVCVTDNSELDKAIALAKIPDVIVTSFGDMIRVPGSHTTLQEAKASGSDIRVVYSPLDALEIARSNPQKSVIFIAVGFETTAPTVAASILQARQEGLKNYYILSLQKVCPPVIRALLDSGEVNLQGLICPGHVSAVIGANAWNFIAEEYGIPCVVAGFEALDILQCIEMLARQTEKGEAKVEIAYKRGVTFDGNLTAQNVLAQVFEPSDAEWRGMGNVPNSGLKLRPEFADFDAEKKFEFDPGPTKVQKGCICGEVLRGTKSPLECKLFRKICNPLNPIGPCMVSSEGSCAAYYHYGESND